MKSQSCQFLTRQVFIFDSCQLLRFLLPVLVAKLYLELSLFDWFCHLLNTQRTNRLCVHTHVRIHTPMCASTHPHRHIKNYFMRADCASTCSVQRATRRKGESQIFVFLKSCFRGSCKTSKTGFRNDRNHFVLPECWSSRRWTTLQSLQFSGPTQKWESLIFDL